MQVHVLIPIFNDWESLNLLINDINKSSISSTVNFLIVNDGSSEKPSKFFAKDSIDIIDLNQNLGHQRAIAIGLCYLTKKAKNDDVVLVMDGDGEDRARDMSLLIETSLKEDKIVFAKRKRRHEGMIFKGFYLVYQIIFRVLIGKTIDFGNFSSISIKIIENTITPQLKMSIGGKGWGCNLFHLPVLDNDRRRLGHTDPADFHFIQRLTYNCAGLRGKMFQLRV